MPSGFDFDGVLAYGKARIREQTAADMYLEFMEQWEAAPHCDPRVLHSPGKCEFCDEAEVLQIYRTQLGLKYTDELQANDALLPGEDRTRASAEAWGGNR
jgi:hypothetical protein